MFRHSLTGMFAPSYIKRSAGIINKCKPLLNRSGFGINRMQENAYRTSSFTTFLAPFRNFIPSILRPKQFWRNFTVAAPITPGPVTEVTETPIKIEPTPDPKAEDYLEIKDPIIIFNNVWAKIEAKFGAKGMKFPREIIWLMGAPGSGKSFNAPWILKARGITAKEVIISDLLTSPEAEAIKREAGLVGDSLVLELLLETLLKPQYENGVLVDGFPRTKVQVECIKLLKDKMMDLYKHSLNDPNDNHHYKRPVFRVGVLFIDEKGSVERQIQRGREAREHNQKVRETGIGKLKEERPTDYNEELARRRYAVFKSHYSTLTELKKLFPFSVINTKVSVQEVRDNILKEFQYQSMLELSEECFSIIQKIPLATHLISDARQNLIRRLDNYALMKPGELGSVIDIINSQFLPNLERHALAGETLIKSTDSLFSSDRNVQMLVDVLSERGYHVTYYPSIERIPSKFDLKTGEITNTNQVSHNFLVKFKKSVIRQDLSEL